MILWVLFLSALTALAAPSTVSPGQVYEWGDRFQIEGRPAAVATLSNAILVSANSDWVVALRSDGSLYAWGTDDFGVTNVPAGNDYVHVAAGWMHGIACKADGTVVEWGSPYSNAPADTLAVWTNNRPIITNAVTVAAGDAHSAALLANGKVMSWGERPSVTDLSGTVSNVQQLASGWYNMIALLSNGQVRYIGTQTQHGETQDTPAGLTNGTQSAKFVNKGIKDQTYAILTNGDYVVWESTNTSILSNAPAGATNLAWVGGSRRVNIVARTDGAIFTFGDSVYDLPAGPSQPTNTPSGFTNASMVYGGAFFVGGIQSAAVVSTNTFYVATTGSDTNPGTLASPFRTVQKGVDRATNSGNVVIVLDGDYGEAVVSKANSVTVRANSAHGASIKEFRVNGHSGITIQKFQVKQWSSENNAGVRIESTSSNISLTGLLVGPSVYAISTNASFGSNYMDATDVNFTASGFTNGSRVWLGACGRDGYWYTNHDTARTVLSNTTTRLYFTSTLSNDVGAAYWVYAYAGGDNTGAPGVSAPVGSGIAAGSNVTISGCVFSNVAAAGIDVNGELYTVSNNTFRAGLSFATIISKTANSIITRNLIIEQRNVLYYSPADTAFLATARPGSWYDFAVANMPSYPETPRTDNVFSYNWVQDVDNQLLLWQSHSGRTNSGWVATNNVFAGFQAHGGASRDGLTLANNTFFQGGYGAEAKIALGIGGTDDIQTNFVMTGNLFANIGDHSNTNEEGSITISAVYAPIISNNFVTRPETIGFNPVVYGANSNWFVQNGGDPQFRNPNNPLGNDGLPFTADDGLRPSPFSAAAGLGALAAYDITDQQPVAHFKQITTTAWQDGTGTNYNTSWEVDNPPFSRGLLRPYTTPEALGNIPIEITFSASNSIGGLGAADKSPSGILFYRWDFGDGQVCITPRPTVTHTYVTTGTVVVSLSVTNLYGNSDTYTNQYRLLAQDGPGTIYHVATNGADTNAGTLLAPFRTIGKGQDVAIAGDVVVVRAGIYGEDTDCDKVASNSAKIKFVSLGARTSRVQFRHPGYVWEGFEMDKSTPDFEGAVQFYQTCDDTIVRNCRISSVTQSSENASVIVFAAPSGSFHPTNGQLNCTVEGNYISDCRGIQISLNGSNHTVFNNIVKNSSGEGDFVRIFGQGHHVYGNLTTNLNYSDGGHADVFQAFANSDNGSMGWCKDVTIEQNVFLGNQAQICMLETDAAAPATITNSANFTNLVIRNNLFVRLDYAGGVDMDGTKWLNNLFYQCATGAHVFAMGGTKGSAYGTVWSNNAFVECGGNSDTKGWYPYVGQVTTNWSFNANYNYVGGTNGVVKTGFTTESNGVNGGLPAFALVSINDYRLTTNSVLLGAGASVAGLTSDAYDQPVSSPMDIGPLAGAVGEGTLNTNPPSIDTQPSSKSTLTNVAATLSVTATGSSLAYQWRLNSNSIASATSSSYSFSTNLAGAYPFDVIVTNSYGAVTSSIATVTVTNGVGTAPSISVQPVGTTNNTANGFTVSVTATGGSLAYQWRTNGTALAGATSSSYQSYVAQTNTYSVVITNSFGSVTSATANVVITNAVIPAITILRGRFRM